MRRSGALRHRNSLETRDGRPCHSDILFDAAAARSNSPYHHVIAFDGNSTAEDYDPGIVGRVEPEALLATLCQMRQLLSRHVKGPRGPGLVDCDIHAPEPGAIHAYMRHQAAASIGDGDVVRNAQFNRFTLTCCDDLARVGKVQGQS